MFTERIDLAGGVLHWLLARTTSAKAATYRMMTCDDVLFHSICSEIYESRIITLTAFQFGVIFVCALWFLLFSVSTIFSQNAY